ncbi:MAG: hypothetical protein GX575_30480 [Candidatus Anammoximicrobium sp.]|nr:hypothetical protein [Candidatus Anammoximicrobium sp.]
MSNRRERHEQWAVFWCSLTKTETATYIDFQVKRAGGSEKLFEAAAKELIHDFSGGVPPPDQ